MEPVADRPRIPEDYGIPTDTEGLLPWSYVAGRLADAKHYWLSTVTPSGAPHTRPVDGFWLDGRLYFGGGAEVALATQPGAEPQGVREPGGWRAGGYPARERDGEARRPGARGASLRDVPRQVR